MTRLTTSVFAFTFLVVFCFSSLSYGQGRVDIVQIYESFFVSRVAALECDGINKATEEKFLSNQLTITIRATQALKERNPDLSDSDVTTKIGEIQNQLKKNVQNEVAINGCSSERIQQLLKMYKMHSTMSLGG